MLEENLIKIYETSFRENREMPALTDYFKGETFSYYEMAKEIAKLHLLFKKAGVKKGDKIALIGRNNPRWCITYIATISYGAVIVPILQDFAPADIIKYDPATGWSMHFDGSDVGITKNVSAFELQIKRKIVSEHRSKTCIQLQKNDVFCICSSKDQFNG